MCHLSLPDTRANGRSTSANNQADVVGNARLRRFRFGNQNLVDLESGLLNLSGFSNSAGNNIQEGVIRIDVDGQVQMVLTSLSDEMLIMVAEVP